MLELGRGNVKMSIKDGRGVLVAGLTLIVMMTIAGTPPRAQQKPVSVAVYKSPTCGCCSKWVDHMRAQGFDLKVQDVEDMGSVKASFGVPRDLGSCHTALVGGYVLEGHVPADVIKRLLSDKPKVTGIAVPGMPVGSPGMEVPGRRADSYNIVSFDRAGQKAIYDRR